MRTNFESFLFPLAVLLAMRQLLQEPAIDDALVASIGEQHSGKVVMKAC